MSLEKRCAAFLGQPASHRTTERLVAFVLAERGRQAIPSGGQTMPVILYFPTEADREGFLDAIAEEMPHLRAMTI